MKASALAFMLLAWGVILTWMYLAVGKLIKAERKA